MIEFSKEEKLNGKHDEKLPRAKGFERKDESKGSELTIDLLGILNRRKWLIGAAGVIGLTLGAAYFLFMPPKYESRAQILLMQNDSASMAAQMARSESSVSEDLLATHMSLLQSKRLVGRAMSSLPIKNSEERTSEPKAGHESSETGVDDLAGGSEFEPIDTFEESIETDAGELSESQLLGADELGADEFELDDLAVREILNSWVEPLATLPSIVESLSEDQTATDYIIDNLYVTRGGDGAARDARVLTVAFRHSDPQDSLRVTHAIVQEYERFIQEQFKDVNSTAYDLIDRARLDLEQKIQEASEDYRAFRLENPLIGSVEGGTNIHAMRYEELSAELSQLLVSIDEAKARIRLVEEGLKQLEGKEGPELQKLALIDDRNAERLGILVTVERGEAQTAAFQALQPERMAGATTEYTSLLGMRASLRQAMAEYGDKHPEVQKLQTQLAEMQQFVRDRDAIIGIEGDQAALTPDDVMLAYVNLLENDLKALEFQKEFLEKQMGVEEALAKELVNAELEDEELAREITRQEDLYNAVLERLRDINMQQDSSGLIQEVIEYPAMGEQVTPNAPIAAAIALLSAHVDCRWYGPRGRTLRQADSRGHGLGVRCTNRRS